MTQEEQEILINELEKDIDRLHALYNQYFMGIEKVEPTVVRKNLERKLNLLRREQIKNTALRFRMQMQIQKYNTQSTYWSRICRQIEAGTYTRQIMLAKKRMDARHGTEENRPPVSEADILLSQTRVEETAGSYELDVDAFGNDTGMFGMSLDDPFGEAGSKTLQTVAASRAAVAAPSPVAAPKAPPPVPRIEGGRKVSLPVPNATTSTGGPGAPPPIPRAAAAPPVAPPQRSCPRPASNTDLSREQAQTIYRRYLAARKKCNESVDNISFDSVSKSLNATLRKGGGNVDFKVVIRGGKAVIKTVKSDNGADS